MYHVYTLNILLFIMKRVFYYYIMLFLIVCNILFSRFIRIKRNISTLLLK